MRIKIQLSQSAIALIDYIKSLVLIEEKDNITNGEAVERAIVGITDEELTKLDYAMLSAAEPELLSEYVHMNGFVDSDMVTTLNLSPETIVRVNKSQNVIKQSMQLNRVKKSYAIKLIIIAYLLDKKGVLADYYLR